MKQFTTLHRVIGGEEITVNRNNITHISTFIKVDKTIHSEIKFTNGTTIDVRESTNEILTNMGYE